MVDTRARAGVYDRESQGNIGSIEDQGRDNQAVCEDEGWVVVARYQDKVSASRFGEKVRKGWPKVLEDVEAGRIDVLVIWEVSRGDRTMDTWVPFLAACRRQGVRIHITRDQETYDPRKPGHRKALLDAGVDAEFETEKISARVGRGLASSARAGRPHGLTAYGFRRLYDEEGKRDEDGRKVIRQVPGEGADIVREIITRIAAQDPIVTIQRDLNDRGVPSPAGRKWSRKTIRAIASNPIYAGLRSHRGKLYEATWEPLVDPAVWEQAQAVLAQSDRQASAPGSYRWLLSYLAVGECGGPLWQTVSREAQAGGRRARYACLTDGCASVDVEALDEYVTGLVFRWVIRSDARRFFERRGAEADTARKELNDLKSELAAARASYARPKGISEEALAAKEHALAPLVTDAERRLISASAPSALLELVTAAEIERDSVRPCWDRMSIAARRSVVTALMEEIRVLPSATVPGMHLSRWSTAQDRRRQAMARTGVRWAPGVDLTVDDHGRGLDSRAAGV